MFIMIEVGKVNWDIYIRKHVWGLCLGFIAIRIVFMGFMKLLNGVRNKYSKISIDTIKKLNKIIDGG